jgi:hypothetical protein
MTNADPITIKRVRDTNAQVAVVIAVLSGLRILEKSRTSPGGQSASEAKEFLEVRLKSRGIAVGALPLDVQEQLQVLASSCDL